MYSTTEHEVSSIDKLYTDLCLDDAARAGRGFHVPIRDRIRLCGDGYLRQDVFSVRVYGLARVAQHVVVVGTRRVVLLAVVVVDGSVRTREEFTQRRH